jgi:DNA-binding SARP family transcriptional activator
MPILSDYSQYKLHQAVITTIKKLGQYDTYEEEIRRRIFEAHQKASSLDE